MRNDLKPWIRVSIDTKADQKDCFSVSFFYHYFGERGSVSLVLSTALSGLFIDWVYRPSLSLSGSSWWGAEAVEVGRPNNGTRQA